MTNVYNENFSVSLSFLESSAFWHLKRLSAELGIKSLKHKGVQTEALKKERGIKREDNSVCLLVFMQLHFELIMTFNNRIIESIYP